MKTSSLFPLLALLILLPGLPAWSKTPKKPPADQAYTGEGPAEVPEITTNASPVSPAPPPPPPPAPPTVATPPALTATTPAVTVIPPAPLPPQVVPAPVPPADDRIGTLVPADLREIAMQPPAIQKLIENALQLTTLNLTYRYGGADPKGGGMDCSGTVYYLLTQAGVRDVPRDASGMYKWIWQTSRFNAVVSPNPRTFELAPLKPGDLLFWTGTYQVDRDPPVTHVMIYLGINRHTGRRVMMGASEGRRFNDKPRYGVSAFDFVLPGKKAATESADAARFIGYGSIPGLADQPSANR